MSLDVSQMNEKKSSASLAQAERGGHSHAGNTSGRSLKQLCQVLIPSAQLSTAQHSGSESGREEGQCTG